MEHSEAVEATKTNNSVGQHNPAEQVGPESTPSKSSTEPKADLSDIEELVMISFKPTTPAAKEKLYKFLHDHHKHAPEIKYLMWKGVELINFNPALERLAKSAIKNSPNQDVQGAALYLLADGYRKAANFAASLEGLNLTVDSYISLMHPEIEEKDKHYFDALKRWQPNNWETIKEKAQKYIDLLNKKYNKVKLYAPYLTKDGKFSFAEISRIGKKAKCMSLAMKNSSVGGRIATLELNDIKGDQITLSDHRGKVVILYIWSSQCEPCKKSIPYYKEIYSSLKKEGQNIEVITLSIDDNQKQLDEFMKENSMPFINCRIGKNNRLLYEWDVSTYPTCILIDKQGIIHAKGQFSKNFLWHSVRKLL